MPPRATLRKNAARSLPVWALAATAALTLSACSGAADSAAEADEGPLSAYFSVLMDDEQMTDEKLQEQQRLTEEIVAACMQDEGFEYTPDTQGFGTIAQSADEEDGPTWGTKEFAEQYGYGFVDSPGMNGDDPVDEYVDPNEEYVSSLSESEQTAYYETLWGAGPSEEQMAEMEEGGGYTSDWTQEGCQGKARHDYQEEHGGFGAAYEDPEFAELFTAMQEVWDLSANDTIVKLDAEWSSCMADKGYPDIPTANDASSVIMDEYSALWESTGEEASEPKKADLDALKKREIELAVADFDCRKKTNYEKISLKEQFAAEQAFVDEHKTELDAMVAKYQASSAKKEQ